MASFDIISDETTMRSSKRPRTDDNNDDDSCKSPITTLASVLSTLVETDFLHAKDLEVLAKTNKQVRAAAVDDERIWKILCNRQKCPYAKNEYKKNKLLNEIMAKKIGYRRMYWGRQSCKFSSCKNNVPKLPPLPPPSCPISDLSLIVHITYRDNGEEFASLSIEGENLSKLNNGEEIEVALPEPQHICNCKAKAKGKQRNWSFENHAETLIMTLYVLRSHDRAMWNISEEHGHTWVDCSNDEDDTKGRLWFDDHVIWGDEFPYHATPLGAEILRRMWHYELRFETYLVLNISQSSGHVTARGLSVSVEKYEREDNKELKFCYDHSDGVTLMHILSELQDPTTL